MTIFLCKLAAAQGLEPSATYDADGPPWRAKNLLTAPSSIWWQIARLDGDVVRLLLDDSARLPEVQEKVNRTCTCERRPAHAELCSFDLVVDVLVGFGLSALPAVAIAPRL